MKIQLKNIFLGTLVLWSIGLSAQVTSIQNEISKEIYSKESISVIKIYEKLASSGKSSRDLFQKLGDFYYFDKKYFEANIWYTKLLALSDEKEVDLEYLYRYSNTLKLIGDIEKSAYYLKQFIEKETEETDLMRLSEDQGEFQVKDKNSGRFSLELASINSSSSDFGAITYKNELIFSSTRRNSGFFQRIDSDTNENFISLYSSNIGKKDVLGHPKLFAKELHTKFNISTPVFSNDNNTIYFTRNSKRKKRGTTVLKIFKATLINGRWKNITELPFNSEQFNTGHPALSSGNDWLYFASDREGGFGNSDLFRVAIHTDGTYGEPSNLGEHINSKGQESFPFITSDNELYFVTDGFPGLGGLDVFGTKINIDGTFNKIQNIGEPINSSKDDFAYYINSDTRKGFVSSNRSGSDEIYQFNEDAKLPLDCIQNIHGVVYDKSTGKKLEDVVVSIQNSDLLTATEVITDSSGSFQFQDLSCGVKYRIKVKKDNYGIAEEAILLKNRDGSTQLNFELEATNISIKNGDNLVDILKLKPIYFDFDKSDIRADVALELDTIIAVLENYPGIKIDIQAHTDSRGDSDYNLKLSKSRAIATALWIAKGGIEQSRVICKGFGENELIKTCNDFNPCSEVDHQINRRSEIFILSF